jgi:beta-galactosidase
VDEISVIYQTAAWSKPARLVLKEAARTKDLVTVEVRAYDKTDVFCPDAANLVRFDLTGDGRLLDNLGTARGSRAVQLANGRAQISLQLSGRRAVVTVAGKGFSTQFLNVAKSK